MPGNQQQQQSDNRKVSRRSISRPPAGSNAAQSDPIAKLQSILGTTNTNYGPEDLDELQLDDSATLETIFKLTRSRRTPEGLENYKEHLEHFYNLHEEIGATTETLGKYHDSLVSFQKDIELLSSDMEALQTRSERLGQDLKKHKHIEERLAPLLEALVIPPPIMKQIIDGEINARWRVSLAYIVKRKKELAMLKDQQEFNAIKSAEYQIQLIISKACEKIRDFIVARIRRLRMARVLSVTIQQNLLENKELFVFLYENHQKLALELRQAYVNTMRWYYSSYFGRYIKSLERLPVTTAERSILLGLDDTGSRRILSGGVARSVGAGGPQDYLNIGNRANIIGSEDPSVISVAASTSGMTYWMETGYRSLNLALLDNCTTEYRFLSGFFGVAGSISSVFNDIISPTFELGDSYLDTITTETYDAYGLLICIRLAKKLEFELQHRKVPVMESYLNSQLLILWPKFQSVMDMHCDSLRKASTKSSSFTMTSQHSATLVPHQVTQHYASFVSGILSLCDGYDTETEPVSNSLLRLRSDFEFFLTKTSAVLNSGGSSAKQETFLYNNYFLVYTILSDAEGKLAEQEKEHFRLLTDAYGAESK